MARSRIAVIVLAAGAGTRYSEAPGAKLLAPLDGRPVLQHVLQAIRTFAPRTTIVVLGHGADTIERTIDWAGEQRVSNPHPEQGLASSMRVGFAGVGAMRVGIAGVGAIEAPVTHVGAIDSPVDGVFIVLGDQPRLRVDVLEALADAAELDGPPILVASYDEPGPRNPVLLLRPAWALADEKAGDHGLAPLIDARPELVRAVRVPGRMPDVDRADDLAALEKDAR